VFLEPPAVGLLGLRNFELPAVGLPELRKHLTGERELRVIKRGLREMSETREEDLMDPIPIPIKALIPAIPKDDGELQELAEDLRVMGCEGLLAKPWNLQSEDTLREFQ
jgi:hypothetical protein